MPTSSFKSWQLIAFLLALSLPIAMALYFCEHFLRENLTAEEQSYIRRYSEVINPKIKAPILIIGASNSAHGIIPSELGLESPVYNFSFNGADLIFQRDFYRQYIKKHYPKPRYLVIAMSPSSFIQFWRKIDADQIYVDVASKDSLNFFDLVKDFKIRKVSVIALEIYMRSVASIEKKDESGMQISKFNNGYVPFDRAEKYSPKKMPPLIFSANEIEALHELIDQALSDNVQVVLVEMPTPDNVYERRELATFQSMVTKMAAQYNLSFYNSERFNELFGKDTSLFNDNVHLRDKGAIVYSREMGAWLRLQGIL